MRPKNFKMLSRGAQFLLRVPHGAVNFAVLESVRRAADTLVADREIFGVILDKRFGAGIYSGWWPGLAGNLDHVGYAIVPPGT